MSNLLRMKVETFIILGITLFMMFSFPLAFADKSISVPQGAGVPGCEESNKCFIPFSVSITPGETVTWSNDDSAAHTVTSGNPSSESPGSLFDSSLLLAGSKFAVKFDYELGKYPYFCIVHPWMAGEIIVKSSPPPTPINKPPVAKYSLNPSTIYAGESIQFDAGDSFDPDGRVAKCEWWFGDGSSEIGCIVSKTYPYETSTTAVLEVTDDDGLPNKIDFPINVLSKPTPPKPPSPDYTELIILGIAVIAAAGGIGYFVSKSKRSSKKSVVTTTYGQSTSTVTSETKKDKICNVCGTKIPQGVNVCPSCGDTYS